MNVSLPVTGRLRMLWFPQPTVPLDLRIVSHYLTCSQCGEQIEGIGSTESQAESRCINAYVGHLKACHGEEQELLTR